MRDEFAPEEFLLDGEEGFGMTDEEEVAGGEDLEDEESNDLADDDEE